MGEEKEIVSRCCKHWKNSPQICLRYSLVTDGLFFILHAALIWGIGFSLWKFPCVSGSLLHRGVTSDVFSQERWLYWKVCSTARWPLLELQEGSFYIWQCTVAFFLTQMQRVLLCFLALLKQQWWHKCPRFESISPGTQWFSPGGSRNIPLTWNLPRIGTHHVNRCV